MITSLIRFGAASVIVLLSGCVDHGLESSVDHDREIRRCMVSPADLRSAQVIAHLRAPGKTALAVLRGDMRKEGPLEFVFSFAPNDRFPAHYHDSAENMVVISGGLYMADMNGAKNGDTMDTSTGIYHKKGDTHLVPARVIHWLFTKDEPVVAKVCMQGPITIYFVEKLK
jgi:hypothetical protein